MRIYEFWTDPSTNQFSTSRFGLWLMAVGGLAIAGYLAIKGDGLQAAAIITGVSATCAGVYFGSTRKDYDKDNA
jgi:hypothetical protein